MQTTHNVRRINSHRIGDKVLVVGPHNPSAYVEGSGPHHRVHWSPSSDKQFVGQVCTVSHVFHDGDLGIRDSANRYTAVRPEWTSPHMDVVVGTALPKWEHTRYSSPKPFSVYELNTAGRDGWQLVTIVREDPPVNDEFTAVGDQQYYAYYFKRELKNVD